ncbi:MAG TPA: hypothetical protein VG518_03395 [Solirubrobacterales bacterium]|nr:hypothetical protein [Solirubrobacterales bacterium]
MTPARGSATPEGATRRLGALALLLSLFILGLAAATPDAIASPLPDADGDALPDEWEAPAEVAVPATTGSRTKASAKCATKKRSAKRGCAPKCKKRGKAKHRKCAKAKGKRKKGKNGKRPQSPAASISAAPTNLSSLGADPNHKDIFVQINYASAALRQSVSCSELDAIVAAFANAPVANPDGKSGINLHIDAGVTCPSRSYDLGGSQIFNAGACPNIGQTMLAAEPSESRAGAFHVAGFSPTCGGGGAEGGAATLHGTKMAVFTDGPTFAHVLMHELGHNLGLDHADGYQPNRISTMNTRLEVSDSGSGHTEALDFQRYSLPALDEHNLDEQVGISAPAEAHRFYVLHYCAGESTFRYAWPGDGPIDWNCSSTGFPMDPPGIDSGTVSADVNGDGQLTVLPATPAEWPLLDYASGGQIGPR